MKNIIKSMIFVIALSVLLTAPQSVSAKTGKGISIEKTFAKGTRDEISRKVYDKNQDGYLSKKEVRNIKNLSLYTYQNDHINSDINIKGISKLKYLENLKIKARRKVYNFKELKNLSNLKYVKIDINSKEKRVLDFRKSKKLKILELSLLRDTGIVKINKNNHIKVLSICGIENGVSVANKCYKAEKIELYGTYKTGSLNINNRKNLISIYLDGLKKIKKLNITKCPKLEKINVIDSDIEKMDIVKNSKVEKIVVFDSKIGNMNIKRMGKLKNLRVEQSKLSEITMEDLNSLYKVYMDDIKKLKEIEYRNLNRLKEIDMSNMKNLRTLTIDNTPRLWSVTCMHGILSELNIFGKNSIGKMRLFDNKLTKFEYSNLPYIYYLDIGDNRIGGKFDMSLYPNLESFYCENNLLEEIYCGEKDRDFYVINCKNNKIKLIHAGENAYVFVSGMNCKNNPGIVIKVDVEDYI